MSVTRSLMVSGGYRRVRLGPLHVLDRALRVTEVPLHLHYVQEGDSGQLQSVH